MSNIFSVISVLPASGQIVCDHVVNTTTPFVKAAQERQDTYTVLLCAVTGIASDDDNSVTYAGESAVYAETVLSQPDVFGAQGNTTEQPFTVILLADDTQQIICEHVMATSGLHAFSVAIQERENNGSPTDELLSVCSFPGHLTEDETIWFAGTHAVDSDDLLNVA